MQGDAFGKKALFPVAEVGANDGLNVVLINAGDAFQKGTESRLVRETLNDLYLVWGGYLGVRNDKRRYKGVCPVAFAAAEATDAQPYEATRSLESALVIAVDRQAGGMPTGACELMELQGGNDVIVNFLRQRVAYFNK